MYSSIPFNRVAGLRSGTPPSNNADTNGTLRNCMPVSFQMFLIFCSLSRGIVTNSRDTTTALNATLSKVSTGINFVIASVTARSWRKRGYVFTYSGSSPPLTTNKSVKSPSFRVIGCATGLTAVVERTAANATSRSCGYKSTCDCHFR